MATVKTGNDTPADDRSLRALTSAHFDRCSQIVDENNARMQEISQALIDDALAFIISHAGNPSAATSPWPSQVVAMVQTHLTELDYSKGLMGFALRAECDELIGLICDVTVAADDESEGQS